MARAMVETSPDSFKTQKTLAFLLFHADESHANLDEVIAHAEKGIAVLDPLPNLDNDAESYRFAGNYHFFKGDYPRAAELFNRSLAIMKWSGEPNANAGFALRQLALTYLRQNEPDLASRAAYGAVQADPRNPDRYLQMAEVMRLSKQTDMAIRTLLQGNALIPDKRFDDALRRLGCVAQNGCPPAVQ
jgi:tetratricopeptide (TPR) repeat protein